MSYVSTILGTSGLVRYWRLDDPVASGTVSEELGTGGSSICFGGITFQTPSLLLSDPAAKCADFDGIDAAIAQDATRKFDIGTPAGFSMEAWIKIDALPSTQGGIIGAVDNGAMALMLRSTGKLYFTVTDLYDSNVDSTGTLSLSTTYHIVLTFDKASKVGKYYINGSQSGSSNITAAPVAGKTSGLIGARQQGALSNYFSGKIQEVAIYNVVLNDATIAAHYAAGTLSLDTVLPDADVVTTGWTTAPLYSKLNDGSDATVIQATAS